MASSQCLWSACSVRMLPLRVIVFPCRKPDWLSSAPDKSMPVMPAHCESVDQTPPQFAWPDQGETRYQLELRDAQNRITRHVADRNWLLLEAPLPEGTYHWRVKPLNVAGKGFGEWRQFGIAAGAVPFAVAASRQLLATAKTRQRPRAFPSGAERERHIQNLLTRAPYPGTHFWPMRANRCCSLT